MDDSNPAEGCEPGLLAIVGRESVRDKPLSVDEDELVRMVDETRIGVARAREREVVAPVASASSG